MPSKFIVCFENNFVTSLLDFNSTEVSHPPSFLKLRLKKLEMSFHFTCLWMVPSNSVFPSRNSDREFGGCVFAPQPKPDSVMEQTPQFQLTSATLQLDFSARNTLYFLSDKSSYFLLLHDQRSLFATIWPFCPTQQSGLCSQKFLTWITIGQKSSQTQFLEKY